MKNLTTFVADKEIEIYHSSAIQSGYGHKKITVEIRYNDEYKKFTATTNNMPAYDDACELEGEKKQYALYQIIENSIINEIANWIEEVDSEE